VHSFYSSRRFRPTRERGATVRRDFDAAALDRAVGFKIDDNISNEQARLLGIRRLARAQVLGRIPSAIGRYLCFFQARRQVLHSARYDDDAFLVFGPETRGLPQELLDANPRARSAFR